MKAQIFIMEDNEFYFETIKEVLERMSLTFYPSSRDEFYQLRRLLCRTFFSAIDSIKKESREEILQILENNTDKKTTFLVTCCLGENQEPTLEGLVLYEMFTKYSEKTIIISSTTSLEEVKTIENFCEKNTNCFLFRKSKNSIQKELAGYLQVLQ